MELLYNHKELLNHLPNFHYKPLLNDSNREEKCAIVVAHFGTTDQVARERAYDPLIDDVKARYPEFEVREAYTSRIIMKRLKDKGIFMPSLPEVLEALAEDGFASILIQPTVLIDGVEMESIMRDIEKFKPQFKELRVGTPLLFHPIDYFALGDTFSEDFDGTIVYVGHGTYDASTAQYPMLQYVLRKQGKERIIVSTIEGFPDFEDLKMELARRECKSVLLRPLMYVAGIHAKDDIANEWNQALKEEGYNVSVELIGLGELEQVRQLYLNKIDFALNYRAWDIMEKKNIYRTTGEKL